MAIALRQMKEAVKTTQLVWDGNILDFAYKPGEFTAELVEKLNEISSSEDNNDVAGVTSMLASLLVWWDVLDDDGNRIPVTEEIIRQVPLDFINAIAEVVGKDVNPPESAS